MAQSGKLTLTERLSYGFGDLGYSLPYNMASGFLLFYYISVVQLPAAAVGTIFLVARLLDAVIDMGVGLAIDRTKSRWGRTRPYFLFTAVPYALVYVAVFAVPDWSQGAQLAYAFVTFKALGILMSLGSIPYTALMPMMTLDTTDRLKLSGMRSIGTSLSVVLGTAATRPLLDAFGGDKLPQAYQAVAAIFAVISVAAILNLFSNCRERHAGPMSEKIDILPSVSEMLRNRAWLVAFAFCLLYFIRFGGMMAVTINFAIDVMGKPWLIPIMLPAVAGTLLLSSFIAPPILARTGIRKGCFAMLLVAAALFGVLPLCESSTALFLTVYVAGCLATSLTITAAFTMIAETVDWHEWRFGSRKEGLLSAGVSLATKVGMALGTAGIAFMLAAADYQPGAVSEGAKDAIRWTYYGGTVALLVVQAIVALFWPMDGMHGQIRQDIDDRAANSGGTA